MASVSECLELVKARVEAATEKRREKSAAVGSPGDAAAGAERPASGPRLVAVSKTKPVEAIREAYEAGHRHFGENYVQEIVEKAPQLPTDIKWHFIGHLQGNKVGMLLKGCPTLSCLETIDSEKLARAVNKAWLAQESERKLLVMVQVNSSGEETKNGVDPQDVAGLCNVIATECAGLQLAGLMTIGAPDYSGCRTEDFETLMKCREEAAALLSVDVGALELSMGMSADYENAILEGSTSVRVGSSIFGARSYPAKAAPAAPPA
eukprot:TRINITY_DN100397_c0_g1_i1.p1 TRINITY_DN100397_c0_g1~~TRINITY_DN100397_c0_g1_i1.p1  ORF type:complete len:288 (-),score=66.49 TRINITY_DN100397_c0_g1_i1:170-961(-)